MLKNTQTNHTKENNLGEYKKKTKTKWFFEFVYCDKRMWDAVRLQKSFTAGERFSF